MSESLITTKMLCERLALGKKISISLMAEHGVLPINMGYGRGRGFRWLSSAVDDVILKIHGKAQSCQKRADTLKDSGDIRLVDLSLDDLYNLTNTQEPSSRYSGAFSHR